MGTLFELAHAVTERLIMSLPELALEAHDTIAEVPMHLALSRRDGRLRVDLRETGGPHAGNLNTPPAVVRAAVLYALRVVLREPSLPLNDGTLASVDILTRSPSLLAPPPDAAIVGGNVETSQRLVDLMLMALGDRAASAGTMNNLVLGRAQSDPDPTEWAFYETLGGGLGASARGPGRSARQLHMTNTRATDPEVLAERLPLEVIRFQLRHGSGGRGLHPGGDGLVRELEVKRPTIASLLAAWRPAGAPGLNDGGAGAPGRAFLVQAGARRPWGGEAVTLAPGDRIIVETPGGGGWGRPEEGA
jgi:5-oxoprolinase (ATP-hydrolysing)